MLRVPTAFYLLFACLLGACLLGSCGSTPARPRDQFEHAVWVTRYEYRTAEDIRRVIKNCADLGLSSVYFQVRGNGTVYYKSSVEAWSEVHNFADPGFDPLAIAVEAAHARGLLLHAWVNMVPGWRGALGRAVPRQLVKARPAWFLGRKDKTPVDLGEGYYWLNPCLPEVRRYLASLCEEIVTGYDVDGLHLDHIRFSDLEAADQVKIPGDRHSIDLFREKSGKLPREAPASFEEWKADCVTQLVREISAVVRAEGNKTLSAAVFANPVTARDRYCQDWAAWTRLRLIDAVVPMNYEDDDLRFRSKLEAGMLSAQGVRVIEGVGLYKHKLPAQTIRQMDLARDAGASGVALFSYSQLFRSGDMQVRKRRREIGKVLGRQ